MEKNGRTYDYVKKWGKVIIEESEVVLKGFHFERTNTEKSPLDFPINEERLMIIADAIDRLNDAYSVEKRELKKLKAGVV